MFRDVWRRFELYKFEGVIGRMYCSEREQAGHHPIECSRSKRESSTSKQASFQMEYIDKGSGNCGRVTVAPFSPFSFFDSGLRFCQLKQILCCVIELHARQDMPRQNPA